jgi:hypothetical protein
VKSRGLRWDSSIKHIRSVGLLWWGNNFKDACLEELDGQGRKNLSRVDSTLSYKFCSGRSTFSYLSWRSGCKGQGRKGLSPNFEYYFQFFLDRLKNQEHNTILMSTFKPGPSRERKKYATYPSNKFVSFPFRSIFFIQNRFTI